MNTPKRKILLGLTGTVASTLYLKIIKQFQDEGFHVDVVLTEKATHFLKYEWRDPSNDGLMGSPYRTSVIPKGVKFYEEKYEFPKGYTYKKNDLVPHIELKENYSAFVVICSANTLFKIAHGVCDNLLSSVARAWPSYKPFIIAPAMNTDMWEHPMTEQHISKFKNQSHGGYCTKEAKHYVVPPQKKVLACGEDGMGALADIKDIVKVAKDSLRWFVFPTGTAQMTVPVYPHPGAFGYKRKQSTHSGVDLYSSLWANKVHPFEEGIVVSIEKFTGEALGTTWWNDTSCVLVKGASGVICYGEIDPVESLKVGGFVKPSTHIGHVMRVIKEGREHPEIPGWEPSMLHVELYPFGTTKAVHGFCDKHLDPTPFILDAFNEEGEGLSQAIRFSVRLIKVTYEDYKV